MITIPSLQALFTSIKGNLEAELGVTIPSFGKSFLRALTAVQAAKFKAFYLAIGSVQKNVFPDIADSELTGGTLERFGRVKLGRDPFPARAGEYEVDVTGEIGGVIPASTTFKSDDDSTSPGLLFVLDDEFTLTATTDTITLRALTAGLDAELAVSDQLTATAPIPLVNKSAIVTGISIEPLAAEDLEEYRRKTVESFRLESQGGAGTDYRLWSFDAQGVQNVYPYTASGAPGEVDIFIEATIADSTDGKGTPSAGLISDVEDVVNFDPDPTLNQDERGRRPLTADPNYLPVTPLDIDIVISDFANLTTAKEDSIIQALTTAIAQIRPFVDSIDVLSDKNDILDVNRIISVILSAQPGSVFGEVILNVDGSPVSTYTFEFGEIPYLNSVSYS
jgi:hypothetical protein